MFLAGQSYSGHYLPLLAAELLRLDLVGRGPGQVDVRGLVPVNAWSDTLHDNTAAVEWWFSQGLISARVRTQLLNPRRSVYTGSPGTLCRPLLPTCMNAVHSFPTSIPPFPAGVVVQSHVAPPPHISMADSHFMC